MRTEVKASQVWEWDCDCGEVNPRGDADPEGDDECDGCGQLVTVVLP